MTHYHWLSALADLRAKRDALTDLIATIEAQCLPAATPAKLKKLMKRTNERTSKARANAAGASEPP